jgi:hypothetical protein
MEVNVPDGPPDIIAFTKDGVEPDWELQVMIMRQAHQTIVYDDSGELPEPGGEPVIQSLKFADAEDTEKTFEAAVLRWPLCASQEIAARIASKPPAFVTKLMWEGMPLETRVLGIEAGDIEASGIVETDMTKVFTQRALDYLSAWQNVVNTGAIWHCDGFLGKAAAVLISEGFLLHSAEKTIGYYDLENETRNSEQPGRPGTEGFVRAMMGPEYLQWLKTIP